MLSWIIVEREYGQLGNRLHTQANLLAFCIENRINLFNLSFSEYAKLFQGKDGHRPDLWISKRDVLSFVVNLRWIESFLKKVSRSDKWLRRLSPWITVHSLNDEEAISSIGLKDVAAVSQSCRILVLRSWNVSCPDEIENQDEEVKSILKPVVSFRNKAESFVGNLRREFDTLVGVHARRGDYKNYMQGKFFYSWEQYASWIRQAHEVLQSDRAKVGFLICSDENSPTNLMQDLSAYQTKSQNPIEDLHSLSLCDYLMGPQSSFGTWASWHGDVPRLILKQSTRITSRKQFEPSVHC